MKHKRFLPYGFIAPCVITVIIFLFIPVLYNLIVSFASFKGIDISKFAWVGLNNYKYIFTDQSFLTALKNALKFMALTIFFQMSFGLVMTMLLDKKLFASRLFEVIFFMPVILSSVIIAYNFNQVYEPNFGVLNTFLNSINLSGLTRVWLGDTKTALYCVLVANVYQWTGMSIIYYRAGLANISADLLEAATTDGANGAQKFFYIIFPLLRPAHMTLILTGTIGTLKFFDLVYIMTQGGPAGSTEFPMTYLYKRYSLEANNGVASTVAVVILLIAFLITIIQLNAFKSKE